MLVLRSVVHEQKDTRCDHTIAQHVEKSLGLAVQPLEVLKEEQQGLVEALAQQ